MISVWVDVENYNVYTNGDIAIAWSTQGKTQKINLVVPLTHVTAVEDWGKEGIEINIFNG